jgi:fucose 4-O-acetylase-like acetyltransferase
MTKEESKTLNILKAVAIILVVLGHSFTYYRENFSDGYVILDFFENVIYSIHVPMFVIITGYCSHEQDIKKYIKKKVLRLFIPYLTFAAAKLIWVNVLFADGREGSLVSQIIEYIFVGDRYWFIYMCLGLYLLAPVIWKLQSKDKLKQAIIIMFAVNVVLNLFRLSVVNYFQLSAIISYLPFFTVGYFMRCNREEFFMLAKTLRGGFG